MTSYALVNGRRTVYIPVTKRADASTLAVVKLVKDNLPIFQAAVPDDVRVSYEFDQSPIVMRAINDLVKPRIMARKCEEQSKPGLDSPGTPTASRLSSKRTVLRIAKRRNCNESPRRAWRRPFTSIRQ